MAVTTSLTDNLLSYSLVEDATPLDPSGVSGGVGQVTASGERNSVFRRTTLTEDARNIFPDPRLAFLPPAMAVPWDALPAGLIYFATPLSERTSKGSYILRCTWNGGAEFAGVYDFYAGGPEPVELAPGTQVTAVIATRSAGNLSGSRVIVLEEAEGSGGGSGTVAIRHTGSNVAKGSADLAYSTVTFTTDATAVRSRVYLGFSTYGTLSAGDTVDFAEFQMEYGSSFSGWFSGASFETPDYLYTWAGVADRSDSIRYDKTLVEGPALMAGGGGNFTLSSNGQGSFVGYLNSITATPSDTNFVAVGALGRLNADGTVKPARNTNLANFLTSVCAAANAQDITLVMDPDIASRKRDYVGFVGNLWTAFTQVLVSERLEAHYTPEGHVEIVENRSTTLDTFNLTGYSESSGSSSSAYKYVELSWLKTLPDVFWPEIYPVPGEEPEVISVEAGETVELELQLKASVIDVNQPECVEWVEADPNYYEGTEGVYSVAGSDGLPITPDFWQDQGGFLTVETTDDPSTIRVVVRGCDNQDYAPYRIAMTSGNFYNSLRITGTAIRYVPRTTRIATGADPRLVNSPDPLQVENPFISNLGDALHCGGQTAEANSGRARELGLSLDGSRVAFGFAPGSRIMGDGVNWRVDTCTHSAPGLSVTASPDSTGADFETTWFASTAQTFEDEWEGFTLGEFSIMPLRRE